jgi:hypothetical protein
MVAVKHQLPVFAQESVHSTPVIHQGMIGRLEPFSGSPYEDVEDWLMKFELLANANHWHGQAKCIQLYSCLVGTARLWYNSLPNEDRSDEEHLIAALKLTFQPSGTKFHHFKQLLD